MYNSIKPHYDEGDIWQRKEEYYNQVLNSNGRRMSPHKVIKLEPIPQPGSFIGNQSKVSQSSFSRVDNKQSFHANNSVQVQTMMPAINISQINPKPSSEHANHSAVNQSLKQTDPQRYKVLEERAQLYKKLQIVTVGLPLKQNTQQTQLLSNAYMMPHYKSQKMNELKEQEKTIKKLTVQMLENQTVISRISKTKQSLVDRVDRITKIDKEIYAQLDEDKNQDIQNYLRIAKNLLAQGQPQDKIAAILKKILY